MRAELATAADAIQLVHLLADVVDVLDQILEPVRLHTAGVIPRITRTTYDTHAHTHTASIQHTCVTVTAGVIHGAFICLILVDECLGVNYNPDLRTVGTRQTSYYTQPHTRTHASADTVHKTGYVDAKR